MKLEDQVVSLELSKRLKELGVKQESYFRWCLWNSPNGAVIWDTQTPELATDLDVPTALDIWDKGIAAFTVAELGEMLPQILVLKKKRYQLFISVALDKQWFVVYANEEDYTDNAPIKFMMCHNEADARALMLIYLLENKLITL